MSTGREEPEIGGGTLLFRMALKFAEFLGAPADLILTRPGTPGKRHWGLTALFGAFLAPVVLVGSIGIPEGAQHTGLACQLLLLLFLVQLVAAQAAKERRHRHDVGRKWGGTGLGRVCVATVLFTLVLWLSPALGMAFAASCAASFMHECAIDARMDAEVAGMHDDEIYAREVAERFRRSREE